LREQMSHEGLT